MQPHGLYCIVIKNLTIFIYWRGVNEVSQNPGGVFGATMKDESDDILEDLGDPDLVAK